MQAANLRKNKITYKSLQVYSDDWVKKLNCSYLFFLSPFIILLIFNREGRFEREHKTRHEDKQQQ